MNRQEIMEEIKRSVMVQRADGNLCCFPKFYFEVFGDYNRSILFNELLLLINTSKREDGYFHKSHEEFSEKLGFGVSALKNYMKFFREKGFIETKYHMVNGMRTSHYKVNFEVFVDYCVKKLGDLE